MYHSASIRSLTRDKKKKRGTVGTPPLKPKEDGSLATVPHQIPKGNRETMWEKKKIESQNKSQKF